MENAKWGIKTPSVKIDETDRFNYKNNIKIYNYSTKQWENIPQKDYLNSFTDLDQNINDIIKNEARALHKAKTNVDNEITKLQNLKNITGEAKLDPDKEQLRKLRSYLKELEAEDNNNKGEK